MTKKELYSRYNPSTRTLTCTGWWETFESVNQLVSKDTPKIDIEKTKVAIRAMIYTCGGTYQDNPLVVSMGGGGAYFFPELKEITGLDINSSNSLKSGNHYYIRFNSHPFDLNEWADVINSKEEEANYEQEDVQEANEETAHTDGGAILEEPMQENQAETGDSTGARDVEDVGRIESGVTEPDKEIQEDVDEPDWNSLLPKNGATKDIIEAKAREYGIELDKRKSPASMLKEFKQLWSDKYAS